MSSDKKIFFNKHFKSLKAQYKLSPLEIELKTGLNRATQKNYEFYNDLPNYENLKKLSLLFNSSIDFLLLNSNNKFINFPILFLLASKTNHLLSIPRNHIHETIAQFINKRKIIEPFFDDTEKYGFSESISDNLKIIREKNSVSQGEIAKICDLKSGNSISNIERNKAKLTYEQLLKISTAYNISIHYMITGVPLAYNIDHNLLLSNLIIFDKTATIESIKFLIALMQKILENNNIPIN